MSSTVPTPSAGNTPPAHLTKPKAHDKPAPDAPAGDVFASLLALLGQAPALPDGPTDGATNLTQDTSAQDGTGRTDTPVYQLFAGSPLPLAVSAQTGQTASVAPNTAPAARPTDPGQTTDPRRSQTLEGFVAVESHESVPAAALETGPTAKRWGPAPAFAWRNTPGAAQTAPSRATPHSTGQSPLGWQRVPPYAADPSTMLAGGLTAPRATVALDERFAAQFPRAAEGTSSPRADMAMGAEEGIADSAIGPTPLGAAQRPGSDVLSTPTTPGSTVTGTGDAGGLGGSSDGHGPQGQGSPHQPNLQQAQDRADDRTEVGHWGTGALRHASLRVGEDAATAIDIQLRVQGQQVDVNFATENPEARDALREQASAALSELMQQGGLGLGGVSVGTQGHSRHPSGDPSTTTGQGPSSVLVGLARRNGQSADAAAPTRPRTDGNRPLDVFA